MNLRGFWDWLMGRSDHAAVARVVLAQDLKDSDQAIARADRTVNRALAEVRRLERRR